MDAHTLWMLFFGVVLGTVAFWVSQVVSVHYMGKRVEWARYLVGFMAGLVVGSVLLLFAILVS